ncbi:MAG: hypothetical protein SF051_07120 [Elusimicrobiota bacterium]|nr:hypothetical protein [Elusimicrobiota bacterium]
MRALLVAAALLLSGCDTYHYLAGTLHEDARRPARALPHYEKFIARRPKDPRTCEMRLRAAELYRLTFGRCAEARVHYEAVARDFAAVPACAERGKAGLLACPDYFPLDAGRTWVFVDSASKGRAMRQEWEVRASSGAGGVIVNSLYAGDRRIRSESETYEKRDWAVWRVDGRQAEPLLRYPYALGQRWTASRGKARLDYEVVAVDAVVTTAAGEFTGALKVRETDSRFPKVWRYDYYAPGVGRVKTTLGGPGYENPNAELLRYDGGMLK